MKEIYEINVSDASLENSSQSIYENRINVVNAVNKASGIESEVTILIQGYNRVEKTKQCVESVLKYTRDVKYDLILVDNGSTDDTFEYFKSVEYENVRIVRLSKNIISSFPFSFINIGWIAKYFVPLANDIIVTENWLSNMIKVAESDYRIGMVNPVTSNVSNYQQVDLEFSSFDEMQRKAKAYNISNSSKWHERLRMVTLGMLFTKECLYALGFPHSDIGFLHDFGDDDISFRIRRLGYKLVLAKDTWVHHNHDYRNLEEKDPVEFQRSLEIGRKNFNDKYLGIDSWNDVCNFIPEIIPSIKNPEEKNSCAILGVDVKCGTPILEIKNHLRSMSVFNPKCCAVTSEGKYVIDLQTVCGADNVICCSPENVCEKFEKDSFDYIIVGDSINEYAEPYKIIKNLYFLLKKTGQLFVYLKNTFDIYSFLYSIGYTNMRPAYQAYNISLESFISELLHNDIKNKIIEVIRYNQVQDEIIYEIDRRVGECPVDDFNETKSRLLSDKYIFVLYK